MAKFTAFIFYVMTFVSIVSWYFYGVDKAAIMSILSLLLAGISDITSEVRAKQDTTVLLDASAVGKELREHFRKEDD